MIILWSLLKASLFAGTMSLATVAGCSEEKREPSQEDVFQDDNIVPNALAPGFKYFIPASKEVTIQVKRGFHDAKLLDKCNGDHLGPTTKIYGYAEEGGDATWPGKSFEVQRAVPHTVTWENKIEPGPYILTGADNKDFGDFSQESVVDEKLHWAYSLPNLQGCDPELEECTIEELGVPIVTHLHGGHTSAKNDGNPEFFFNKDRSVLGPQYQTNRYKYPNNLEPNSIWYHDHTLGITRLNVYAGLAGFYFIRDEPGGGDTGLPGNKLDLPAFPYEVALAIQDRMFKNNGEFLYPAFPGDPEYEGFIVDEGANTSSERGFPVCGPSYGNEYCGPTALAEFFGDHMLVNGKVWPTMPVEPRHYRLRLLNGCDSRFLVLEFEVQSETGPSLLPFYVIGSDQGLKTRGTSNVELQNQLVMAPGERYDVIVNFADVDDKRVIMKNLGGDMPFGGEIPEEGGEEWLYLFTDRVMAFDVEEPLNAEVPDDFNIKSFNRKLKNVGHQKVLGTPRRTRKVGLFEGRDEYNRLQPLLGPAEPATDYRGREIFWPNKPEYAGLTGQVEGTVAWHTEPSTENPKRGQVELWEIWNASGDAHPIHLHLVDFEVLGRYDIIFDSSLEDADDPVDPEDVEGDGVYLVEQPIIQHNGQVGRGRKIVFPDGGCEIEGEIFPKCYDPESPADSPYNDIGYPKDVVIANPGQVTLIKAKFTKPGRYVWHCHILSHEDHEMMRVMRVGRLKSTARNLQGDFIA